MKDTPVAARVQDKVHSKLVETSENALVLREQGVVGDVNLHKPQSFRGQFLQN